MLGRENLTFVDTVAGPLSLCGCRRGIPIHARENLEIISCCWAGSDVYFAGTLLSEREMPNKVIFRWARREDASGMATEKNNQISQRKEHSQR